MAISGFPEAPEAVLAGAKDFGVGSRAVRLTLSNVLGARCGYCMAWHNAIQALAQRQSSRFSAVVNRW